MALLRRLFSIALICLPAAGPAWGTPNLLSGPEFDDSTAPWSIDFEPGGSADFSNEDYDGCPLSGSLLFDVQGTNAAAKIEQCVALPPGQPPTRARVLVRRDGNNAWIELTMTLFGAGAPCQGAFLSSVHGPTGGAGYGWTTYETSLATVPANAAYALFRIQLGKTGTSFLIRADRSYLGDGNEIFSENFEIGDTCRFPAATEP